MPESRGREGEREGGREGGRERERERERQRQRDRETEREKYLVFAPPYQVRVTVGDSGLCYCAGM